MRPLSEIRNFRGNYHLKSAIYHYERDEYRQALTFLRKALADEAGLDETDHAVAQRYLALSLYGLGDRLAADGDLAAGIEEIERAAEAAPGFADIHFRLASLLEQAGRIDEAVDAYRRALEHHDGYLDAWVSLGSCLARVGRETEAAEAFERAFDVRREALRVPFERGLAELRAGRTVSALAEMHEVFLASRRLADLHRQRALDAQRAGDAARSLEQVDLALTLCPRYPDLHNQRGLVLCELDRPAEAAEAFGRAAALGVDATVPRLNRVFALIRAGRTEDAEGELQSLLRDSPDQPVARAELEKLRGPAGKRPGGPDSGGHRSIGGTP